MAEDSRGEFGPGLDPAWNSPNSDDPDSKPSSSDWDALPPLGGVCPEDAGKLEKGFPLSGELIAPEGSLVALSPGASVGAAVPVALAGLGRQSPDGQLADVAGQFW